MSDANSVPIVSDLRNSNPPSSETLDVSDLRSSLGRKEKRKAAKKAKRKRIRREMALKEIAEEETRINDPEEQLRARLLEQEEAERMERDRREFEERERLWMEVAALRQAEEDARRKALEESQTSQVGQDNENDEDDDWEYVDDGPPEIIWQGNEIIVKKKRVKTSKRKPDQQSTTEDADRPTSNPLPPQHAAFAAFKNGPSLSARQVLENVAQQIPNFGTEQDKAHCPFHLKTGACRFGSHCSRVHFHPDKSCTILIKNMYNGPGLAWEQDEGLEYTDEEVERSYEEFYEDVHTEFLKFGEIVNFKACRNGSFHLRGNVYIHYRHLDSAILAYNSINGRYFAGRQITCEFVGVTKWKVAICGEFMKSRLKTCSHGSACNFIHCFRNPGGDYEWADWDKQPPKYWVKKMAALFGPAYISGELTYNQQAELGVRETRYSSKKKTENSGRYCHRRSRSGEDYYSSGSRGDHTDDTKSHSHRHLSKSQSSRRKAPYFPNEHEQSKDRYHNTRSKSQEQCGNSGSSEGITDENIARYHHQLNRLQCSRRKATDSLDQEQSNRYRTFENDSGGEFYNESGVRYSSCSGPRSRDGKKKWDSPVKHNQSEEVCSSDDHWNAGTYESFERDSCGCYGGDESQYRSREGLSSRKRKVDSPSEIEKHEKAKHRHSRRHSSKSRSKKHSDSAHERLKLEKSYCDSEQRDGKEKALDNGSNMYYHENDYHQDGSSRRKRKNMSETDTCPHNEHESLKKHDIGGQDRCNRRCRSRGHNSCKDFNDYGSISSDQSTEEQKSSCSREKESDSLSERKHSQSHRHILKSRHHHRSRRDCRK